MNSQINCSYWTEMYALNRYEICKQSYPRRKYLSQITVHELGLPQPKGIWINSTNKELCFENQNKSHKNMTMFWYLLLQFITTSYTCCQIHPFFAEMKPLNILFIIRRKIFIITFSHTVKKNVVFLSKGITMCV